MSFPSNHLDNQPVMEIIVVIIVMMIMVEALTSFLFFFHYYLISSSRTNSKYKVLHSSVVTFVTADILICQSRKKDRCYNKNNNINYGSVLFVSQ